MMYNTDSLQAVAPWSAAAAGSAPAQRRRCRTPRRAGGWAGCPWRPPRVQTAPRPHQRCRRGRPCQSCHGTWRPGCRQRRRPRQRRRRRQRRRPLHGGCHRQQRWAWARAQGPAASLQPAGSVLRGRCPATVRPVHRAAAHQRPHPRLRIHRSRSVCRHLLSMLLLPDSAGIVPDAAVLCITGSDRKPLLSSRSNCTAT